VTARLSRVFYCLCGCLLAINDLLIRRSVKRVDCYI